MGDDLRSNITFFQTMARKNMLKGLPPDKREDVEAGIEAAGELAYLFFDSLRQLTNSLETIAINTQNR